MNKKESYDILAVGEIVWDSLPSGLFLGGAPLNVCLHANELGMSSGIISSVGNDRLGNEAVKRIRRAGVDTSLIQTDTLYETGFVEVELDKEGDPEYKIVQEVAWDYINFDETAESKINNTSAVVFGSLALRSSVSQKNIFQLLQSTTAVAVMDLNLRYPHYSEKLVNRLLTMAEILKLNRQELDILAKWFNLSPDLKKAIEELAQKFGFKMVAVTAGGSGAFLWQEGVWEQQESYDISVKDAVGAGDAFLAALLFGWTNEYSANEMLRLANAAGAFVAGKPGATPAYDLKILRDFMGNPVK